MSVEHHERFAPSMLPALELCPCFKRKKEKPGDRQDASLAEGGKIHQAFASMLRKEDASKYDLSIPQAEGLEWAVSYTEAHSSGALHVEEPLEILDENFEVLTFGTPDAWAGGDLFDLKSSSRINCDAQMLAYAIGIMQKEAREEVTVHVLYADEKRAFSWKAELAYAMGRVKSIIAEAGKQGTEERPCDYCGWCASNPACPALDSLAIEVAKNRPDWKLDSYHSSEIQDPRQMAKALNLAKILSTWCESVEYNAKEMASVGIEIPGWKLQQRAGSRKIEDIMAAFGALGIAQENFLKSCSVSITKIEDAYAKENKMGAAEAKRKVSEKLGSLVSFGAPSVALVRERKKGEKERDA